MSQHELLGARPRRTTSKRFAHLLSREQEGSILMLTAAMMVVLMGIVGLAVDVGHQMTEYRQAQNAADAAALAGTYALYAGGDETAATNAANLLLQQNGFSVSSMTLSFLDTSDQPTSDPKSVYHVKADVRTTFPTYFIRALGIGSRSVGASATAQVRHVFLCELCVLNQSAKAALTVSGGGNITATNIRIIDNSNNPDALDDSGGGVINDQGPDAEVDVVGGVYGGGTLVPSATTGIQPIPDPLAWLKTPAITTVQSDVKMQNTQSQTISPGVYNKIDDQSSGTLTLNPGIYVITGELKVTGSGPVVGNGVMLYFACPPPNPNKSGALYVACTPGETDGGNLALSGSGTLTLSAMTAAQAQSLDPTGSLGYANYVGILVYYDRNNATSQNMTITGNGSSSSSASSITGTIYGKSVLVTISGNGSTATALDSFIVSDQAKFTGSTGSSGSTPTSALNMTFQQGLNAPFSLLDGLVQ